MPKLIIVRGVAGSGKSTFSKKLIELTNDFEHFEADMYFMNDGVYKYDKTKISTAHEWCYGKVLNNIKLGQSCIVSNTFIKNWEMEKYINLYNYCDIYIVEMCTQYESIHNVPKETIQKMKEGFEKVSTGNAFIAKAIFPIVNTDIGLRWLLAKMILGEKAGEWWMKPLKMFNGKIPYNIIQEENGTKIISDLLLRIQKGGKIV